MGACYGDALFAARAAGLVDDDTVWASAAASVEPNPENREVYDRLYAIYRDLYPATQVLRPRPGGAAGRGGPRPGRGVRARPASRRYRTPTGRTVRFHVALTTPANDAYQASTAVTRPR